MVASTTRASLTGPVGADTPATAARIHDGTGDVAVTLLALIHAGIADVAVVLLASIHAGIGLVEADIQAGTGLVAEDIHSGIDDVEETTRVSVAMLLADMKLVGYDSTPLVLTMTVLAAMQPSVDMRHAQNRSSVFMG